MKARAPHVNTKRLRSGGRKWKLSLERDFLLSVALVVDETERSRTFLLFLCFGSTIENFKQIAKDLNAGHMICIFAPWTCVSFSHLRYETKSAINWKISLTFPSLSKIKNSFNTLTDCEVALRKFGKVQNSTEPLAVGSKYLIWFKI